VLLHHPFESFEPVVQFLREAVARPRRAGHQADHLPHRQQSVLMDLLIEAARRGKEVLVVVELKARFDEEANINWAERLEAVGAQVVYGIVGLKTHAKLLLVTRREGHAGRRALRPPVHRQLQPAHGAAVHRRGLPHRRPGADRRRRRGVPATGQPDPLRRRATW
jgi:polyphosphate kinase